MQLQNIFPKRIFGWLCLVFGFYMINFTHKLPPVLSYKTLQDKTASGAVLIFSGTHLFAKLIYVSRKRFSTGSQGENRGSGS